MPRFGTTLAEQIIASIPDVRGAGKLSTVANLALDISKHEGAWPDGGQTMTLERADALHANHIATLAKIASDAVRVTDKMPVNFQNLVLAWLYFQTPKSCISSGRRRIRA